MTNPRFQAILEMSRDKAAKFKPSKKLSSASFGKRVFNRSVMQKILPKEVFVNVLKAMEGREKIKPEYADVVAVAAKEWAISHGATHYCHWFHPLTGISAEKQDAFIDWDVNDKVIEKFNGKQLVQGEPDASSFPSGGLRSTYEARGYTGWDPTSPMFLWIAGGDIILCIPSVFYSWTGSVLDNKIPLLRSEKRINQAVMRLLHLTGLPAHYIFSTLGLEQEYFVIDRRFRNLRPDLVLLGKTVFGTPSSKGQELQDHYFGSVKDRIMAFMCDFEEAAIELGIPVKTRHNEVAPAQHEVACVFEKASAAIDHNILLMELMRQVAHAQQLACLLHEKPFAGINGSGKHANWSLATDTGINLLDPTDTPHNNWHFLILLTAILHAVYQHSTLLRASVGAASNDYRLGGHEAPPAIISIYLGEELENLLNEIEHKGMLTPSSKKGNCEWEFLVIPDISRDNTDRNRTSPFAFTGNKFEFRAVGSSAHVAFPITVLNLIVAESLEAIMADIEKKLKKGKEFSVAQFAQAVIPVLQKYLKVSKGIRFSGNNYSEEWVQEAKRRHLPNIHKSPDAFTILTDPKTIRLFEGILTPDELRSRQEILLEHYACNMTIEANLMIDIFKTQILPAALSFQQASALSYSQLQQALNLKRSQSDEQVKRLKDLQKLIEASMQQANELEMERDRANQLSIEKKAKVYSQKISLKMEALRTLADQLETLVDDRLWPLPKYRELLFMV